MNENVKQKKWLAILAIVVSLIYLGWRMVFTLPLGPGKLVIFLGVGLFVAEVLRYVCRIEQIILPDKNSIPEIPAIPDNKYPEVDVLIATHEESVDLVYKTINGCLNMDYPDQTKVHIYICDDMNRPQMAKLALDMNVEYFAAPKNRHGKAGNLNYALSYTSSPIVAVLDADMIPLHTFLMDTVPYFFIPEVYRERQTEKIGYIQTPQGFYNADLFQYNLYSEDKVPNEQNYFSRELNFKKNRSNSALCFGTNVLFSREALVEIGGMSRGYITEHISTGIKIQKKGYTCYSINKVEALGLAPNDLKSLIEQRKKWTRGLIRTIQKSHLMFAKGLTIKQKLSNYCTLLNCYHPFCRLMYLVAPILSAILGLKIVNNTFVNMIYIWAIYQIIYNLAVKQASCKIRYTRLTNVYETALCPYLLMPALLESLGIRKDHFDVTKKDYSEVGNSTFQYTIPHLILAGLTGYSIYISVIDTFLYRSLYSVILCVFLIYNLYTLVMSVFFMLGRSIERNAERIRAFADVEINCKNGCLCGKSIDLSDNGFSVSLDFPEYISTREEVEVLISSQRYQAQFRAKVMYITKYQEKYKYAFSIIKIDEENKSHYSNLIYDRLPDIPEHLTSNASVFSELFENIHKRLQDYVNNSRRLARIELDKNFETVNGESVIMYNFNYEYMMVGYENIDYSEEIALKIGNQTILNGQAVKHKKFKLSNGNYAELYRITNLDQFVYEQNFKDCLKNWMYEYQTKCMEKDLRNSELKHMINEEFDEINYVWGGEKEV